MKHWLVEVLEWVVADAIVREGDAIGVGPAQRVWWSMLYGIGDVQYPTTIYFTDSI
jgi:hypothetical protein